MWIWGARQSTAAGLFRVTRITRFIASFALLTPQRLAPPLQALPLALQSYSAHISECRVSFTLHELFHSSYNFCHTSGICECRCSYLYRMCSCHNELNSVLPRADATKPDNWNAFFFWKRIYCVAQVVNHTKRDGLYCGAGIAGVNIREDRACPLYVD